MPSRRWAIVGGGMLGIATALELAKRGQSVTLYDPNPEIGGLTTGWQLGDVRWDRYYHVILLSDSYLRSLLSELDLDREIEWVQTRTGFYSNGRLHSLSSSIDFLKFPVLSLYQKFRLGSTIFFGSKIRNWKPLEKITVETWLRRWSGNSTFEKIWLPLLKCKLGDAYQRTNASFIWAYIQRMYSARRSGLKQEMFGYVPGGYDRVLQALAKHLHDKGIELRLGRSVERITQSESGSWLVASKSAHESSNSNLSQATEDTFERVVVTTPSPVILNTVEGLPNDERNRLSNTEYLGVVCTSLLLDRPLGGFYVTNIIDPGTPLTGIIEMGSILPPEKLGGHYLVYLPKYMMSNDVGFDESNESIHERCLSTLEKMFPSFRREHVRAIQTARARHVMALPTLDYSTKRAPVCSELKGLYMLNSSRIVDGTLNVNEVLRLVSNEFHSIWQNH